MSGRFCAICGTELRVVSMTSDGATYKCQCGAASWTQLTKGELNLADCTERPDCTAPVHLSTCPQVRGRP